jgi:hypothetical protein
MGVKILFLTKCLRDCIRNGGKATLGNSTAWRQYTVHQSSTYMDEGIAKVILTWYIATTLLGVKHPQPDGEVDDDRSTVITLSRCYGYLVAFRPELLPNDWNDTQDVYKTMVRDLREKLGFWVELVVYIAPSSEGAHLQGHYTARVESGEFITVLWTLATHNGITRPDVMSPAGA